MFGFYVHAFLMWLFFSMNGGHRDIWGVCVKIFRVCRYAFFVYLKVKIKQSVPEVSIINFYELRGFFVWIRFNRKPIDTDNVEAINFKKSLAKMNTFFTILELYTSVVSCFPIKVITKNIALL